MKRSRRELSLWPLIALSLKNNQITLFSYFTFVPKKVMGLKQAFFYCVVPGG